LEKGNKIPTRDGVSEGGADAERAGPSTGDVERQLERQPMPARLVSP